MSNIDPFIFASSFNSLFNARCRSASLEWTFPKILVNSILILRQVEIVDQDESREKEREREKESEKDTEKNYRLRVYF